MPKIRYQKNLILKRMSFSLAGLLMSVGVMTVLAMNLVYAAPGTLTATINQKSGTSDPNPSYTSVFTVQFSEAIDKSTFTNTDITLGGTAPGQQVQSITEAGSFNQTTYEVRIQATSAGTISPSIGPELITAQNGASGTNQVATSTDDSVTYNGSYAPNEFVMRVDTNIVSGYTGSTSFGVSTNTSNYTYNYNIDCENDGVNEYTNVTGDKFCTYDTPGVYDISITGIFPHLQQSNNALLSDAQKITDVKQWGTNNWSSMKQMFQWASNITKFSATDAPQLSNVSSMEKMFKNASSFNSNINNWNVINIINMVSMFQDATSFNQQLINWNVSNVTNMNTMFTGSASFNKSLNNWSVSSLTSTTGMFAGASSFNQPLNNWNVSQVTNMAYMFNSASSFNQPLNNWNVSQVTNMNTMFAVTAFNQPLNNWDVSNVTDMNYMFLRSGLSTPNYDATLISWSQQTLQDNVIFGAGTSKYCASETQRQNIITNHNWTINDSGKDCTQPPDTTSFITTWNVDNSSQVTIGSDDNFAYDYTVNWGDGYTDANQTGDITHTYDDPGIYTVSITGTFPHFINYGGELMTVEQWGDQQWQSMESSFSGISSLNSTYAKSLNSLRYSL